jgi:hypothetical protein
MSSQPVSADRTRVERTSSKIRVTPTETKPSFLTTEFYAMIAGIVAVLVAAQQADNLDAPLAWTLAASNRYEGWQPIASTITANQPGRGGRF